MLSGCRVPGPQLVAMCRQMGFFECEPVTRPKLLISGIGLVEDDADSQQAASLADIFNAVTFEVSVVVLRSNLGFLIRNSVMTSRSTPLVYH